MAAVRERLDHNHFFRLLQCPALKQSLQDPILMRCGHTVSEVAIHKMAIQADNRCKKTCPLCNVRIKGSIPNQVVRKIMHVLGRRALGECFVVSRPKIAEGVPSDLASISYTGKAAQFIHEAGDWLPDDSQALFNRSVTFVSSVPGSLFHTLQFVGDRDGGVRIECHFTDTLAVWDYLAQCGVEIEAGNDGKSVFFVRGPNAHLLFQLLLLHNEFPQVFVGPLLASLEVAKEHVQMKGPAIEREESGGVEFVVPSLPVWRQRVVTQRIEEYIAEGKGAEEITQDRQPDEARCEPLFAALECPISKRSLVEAVTAWPCGHTVNQEVIVAKIGNQRERAPCQICGERVHVWSPNELVRQCAQALAGRLLSEYTLVFARTLMEV